MADPLFLTQAPSVLGLPGVRVRTLITIRWIAIIGQLIAILAVSGIFDFPLPLWPALCAIGASIAVNGVSSLAYPSKAYLTGRQAGFHLAFDLLQLAVLLFLTGGLVNPFSVLILVPVTISATLLSLRSTVLLIMIATLCMTALSLWALPLPWRGVPIHWPEPYQVSVWAALMLGMLFLAAYAWQVSAEGRRRQQALIATQAALAREQRMSALGSLAAAAAHELGGPLGTITLISKELDDQLGNDPDFGSDIRLLREEAARCRDILIGIAKRAEAEHPFPRLALEAVLHEVVRPFETGRVAITLIKPALKSSEPVTVERSPELLHGLTNLISNAVRHAASQVTIEVQEARDIVKVSIMDDGPGFDLFLLPQLGEPYLGPSRSGSGGTGLGIFIATTLLERIRGSLSFKNQIEGGARVDIQWSRRQLDAREKGYE